MRAARGIAKTPSDSPPPPRKTMGGGVGVGHARTSPPTPPTAGLTCSAAQGTNHYPATSCVVCPCPA